MAKPARPQKERDFRAGFVCAEAFQRMAEPFIGRIAREVDGGLQAPSSELGEVVASAVNLALVSELI